MYQQHKVLILIEIQKTLWIYFCPSKLVGYFMANTLKRKFMYNTSVAKYAK